LILVEKKEDGACLHVHTVTLSAWRYVGHVEKNSYATPKQAKKNNANPKSKLALSHSCGAL
jgi:hypothetical protein